MLRLGRGLAGACGEARRLPAPSGRAGFLAWLGLGSVRRPFNSRAQVGRRPVAVRVVREVGNPLKPPADWSSRTPQTTLLPDQRHAPDERHCASAGRRLATTGSSDAPACRSTLQEGASMKRGWGVVGGLGEIPAASKRNRAPAHLRPGAEWPAPGTQPEGRGAAAVAPGAGRRPSPTPSREPACLTSRALGGCAEFAPSHVGSGNPDGIFLPATR